HPEVISVHLGDLVWWPFKANSKRRETGEDGLNVINAEVEHRAWMVKLGALRNRQHQADATAVEEAHLWNREKMFEVELLFVESHRSLQIVHIDGNLSNSSFTKISRGLHRDASCFWSENNHEPWDSVPIRVPTL